MAPGSPVVYRAPDSRAYGVYPAHEQDVYTAPPPPENEDDLEPTGAELRAAYADAVRQRYGPDAPLMTSAMRARRDAELGKQKKQFDAVRVRVRFADRTQIESSFAPSATMADIYALVDASVVGSGNYVLFQAPPRRDFLRAEPASLAALGFAPAAVLGIRWDDAARNGACSCTKPDAATDAPAPLRNDLRAKARDMPAPPTHMSQVPSVRLKAQNDAQAAREKRKFPKVCGSAHTYAVVQKHRRRAVAQIG